MVQHFEKLEEFWSTLEDIDNSLYVIDSEQSSRITQLLVNLDFLSLADVLQTGVCRKKDCRYADNLASIFGTKLPTRLEIGKNDQQQAECGICYTHRLPIDDELGSMSGSATDYTCENTNYSRAFHSVCLGDWLRSITTTRQPIDVLFGICPYSSDPAAIKIIDAGK
ncbi:E3 ubiquitin-protein ligase FANCL [Linum perenne]